MADGGGERQITVKFVTKLPADLRVPETPLVVPANVKRLGLSQIINTLLQLEPIRPFDFIIDGELLRQTLEGHLIGHSLSAESVLEVEYVPAVVPPKHQHSTPQDDWVSCLDGCGWSGRVVSGSYDGNVRVWGAEGSGLSCSQTFKAHGLGVTALACVPGADDLLVTAGKDHGVLLWQVPASGSGAQLVASYSGHTDAVEALAVAPSGRRMCSSGWDGRLLVWRTGSEVAAEAAAAGPGSAAAESAAASSKKKRKVAAGGDAVAVASGGLKEECVAKLEGHLHCVSAVAFPTEQTIYSGGWDHSVRRWDVATGINTDTYNGSKVVCALACPRAPGPHASGKKGAASAASARSESLVAFGCSDNVLRLWDVRGKRGEALAVKAYGSHAGWVVSVAWSPASEYHLATASHDGTVKVWDMRSPVPLATLSEHTDKALAVSWLGASGSSLISGGADCKMHVFGIESGLGQ